MFYLLLPCSKFRSHTQCAGVSVRDRLTALELAAFTGQEDVVTTILTIYSGVAAGRSLFLAIDRGYNGVCQILLEHYQQNLHNYDFGKSSPSAAFLDCVCTSSVELVDLLLRHAGSHKDILLNTTNCCSFGQCTPMQAALIKNNEPKVQLLFKFGVPVFTADQISFVYTQQKAAKLMFDVVHIDDSEIQKLYETACKSNWLDLPDFVTKRASFAAKKVSPGLCRCT